MLWFDFLGHWCVPFDTMATMKIYVIELKVEKMNMNELIDFVEIDGGEGDGGSNVQAT